MNISITQNATFLALTAACISGVSVFVNKYAVSGLADPILFSALKNTLVAILLVGMLFSAAKYRDILALTRKQWAQLTLIGLVGGAIPFGLFFTGLSLVPAATGAMLHKTLFIWVSLLATMFLRERLAPLQWLGVAVLFLSNMFVGGFGGFTGSAGELLVLGATLLWAVENVFARHLLSELSSIIVASGRMVFGSVFLLLFLSVTGRMSAVTDMTIVNAGWTVVTTLFLFGYVCTWYAALKRAPASYVAALLVPATLVTNVLSAVFVTGTLTGTQVLSGFLVILGTVLVARFAHDTTTAIADAVNERKCLVERV